MNANVSKTTTFATTVLVVLPMMDTISITDVEFLTMKKLQFVENYKNVQFVGIECCIQHLFNILRITCPAGQFGIDGSCFSISSEKATYQGAIQACKENGGALVNLQDRKVWWVIGNKVQYGDEPYWVSNKCNTKLMWIVGEKTGALLANPAGNMDNVPPQLNYVSPSESHHYACQH